MSLCRLDGLGVGWDEGSCCPPLLVAGAAQPEQLVLPLACRQTWMALWQQPDQTFTGARASRSSERWRF